jgi:hypothetical protein
MPVGAKRRLGISGPAYGREHDLRWPGSAIPATAWPCASICRLERVWIDWPIYFITKCSFRRRPILASKKVAKILSDEWRSTSAWVGNWALRYHARSPAFLLLSGIGRETIAGLHAGMEAMDE